MTRTLARLLMLVVVALALAAGAGLTQAADDDPSLVPRSKLTERPYRGLTLVTVGDRVVCTGFVVAPNKIATAAHCLVRDAGKGDFRLRPGLPGEIRVYRGYSRVAGGSSYRPCDVSKAWAHSKFVKSGRADRVFGSRLHDYAVLTTRKGCTFPQDSVMRLWATEAGASQLASGQKIRISGYPADSRFDGMNGLNLWRTEGRVRPVGSDPRHLVFSGFVSQGMSGGPVWRSFSKDSPCGRTQCVVAIVTECAVNARGRCKLGTSDRIGVRITPQVKQTIKKH